MRVNFRTPLFWICMLLATSVLFVALERSWLFDSTCFQQPVEQASEQPKETRKPQNHCASQTVAVIGSLGQFVRSYKDEINALSTLVIAVFTVILGVFTISLAHSTRVAADGARISAIAAQKALLVANQPILTITGLDLREPANSEDVARIAFAFRNVGNSATDIKNVEIEIRLAFVRAGQILLRTDKVSLAWNAAVASQDTSGENIIKTDVITAEDVANFHAGLGAIALIFTVIHQDVLGTRYEGTYPFSFDHGEGRFMRTTVSALNAQRRGQDSGA